jgi:hypothetical protein
MTAPEERNPLHVLLLSLIACGGSLVAIIDPVGTQIAYDNDPFGSPPSRLFSASVLCVSLAIGAAGAYLLRKSFHTRPDATNVA